MPICYVMCAPAGCGKSTRAWQLYTNSNKNGYDAAVMSNASREVTIVSSDEIRSMLFGDEACQDNPQLVFDTYYDIAAKWLKQGVNVILDATNLTKWSRKQIFKAFEDIDDVFYIAIVGYVDIYTALERNEKRSRVVPEKVIEKQYKRFQIPTEEEGFDAIWEEEW